MPPSADFGSLFIARSPRVTMRDGSALTDDGESTHRSFAHPLGSIVDAAVRC